MLLAYFAVGLLCSWLTLLLADFCCWLTLQLAYSVVGLFGCQLTLLLSYLAVNLPRRVDGGPGRGKEGRTEDGVHSKNKNPIQTIWGKMESEFYNSGGTD